MKIFKSILLSSLLVASLGSYAQASFDSEDSLSSIQVTEISPVLSNLDYFYASDKGDQDPPGTPPANNGGGFSVGGAPDPQQGQNLEQTAKDIGTVIQIVDKLIAVGEKVWSIVERGRPTADMNGVVPSVSVLPRGLLDTGSLYDMFGWSEPIIKSFNVDMKNKAGATIVTFRFSVMMQYGGTDGKGGVYLSGLSIVPDLVKTGYGYDFNAQTRLINISNVGTAEKPVASATMELAYQVKNMTMNESKRIRIFVDGRGQIKQLSQQ